MFRRLTPWLALAVLGGFVVAYSAYWWVAAGEMRAVVERWVADWRKAGYTVDHGDIAVAGFPFAVEAAVPEPKIEEGRGVWAWAAERATLHARPWSPTRYTLALDGPHRGRLPIDGRPVTLDAETNSVRGHLTFDFAGRIRGAEASIVGLVAHARELGQTLRADQVTLQLDLPPHDPMRHDDPAGEATV